MHRLLMGLFFTLLLIPLTKLKAEVAKIVLLKGDIRIIPAGGGPVSLAHLGDGLNQGDKLLTHKRSLAKLLFMDGSRLVIGPSSKLLIKTFKKSSPGIITLIRGQVRALVSKNYMGIKNKDGDKFIVKTKAGSMGVRGTDFQVFHDQDQEKSQVAVKEGRVFVTSSAGKIMLKAGQASRFDQQKLDSFHFLSQLMMEKRRDKSYEKIHISKDEDPIQNGITNTRQAMENAWAPQ